MSVIEVDTLTRWADLPTGAEEKATEAAGAGGAAPREPVFPVSPSLNKLVILWGGDICRLRVDAVANPTNETLTDRSGIAGHIFAVGGIELEHECGLTEGCRTGEAICTKGGRLLAPHVIHTVGPRFNPKYETAAENALHSCYRHVMSIAKEEKFRTIAMPCLYAARKQYPRKDAAHIALRTVRRFLEHFPDDFDAVVLVMDTPGDMPVYTELMPLYFPRSASELHRAAAGLPGDVGNEWGEKVIPDRVIRIGAVPGSGDTEAQPVVTQPSLGLSAAALYEAEAEAAMLPTALGEGAAYAASPSPYPTPKSFESMRGDQDAERVHALQGTTRRSSKELAMEQEVEKLYQRDLARSGMENLRDIEALNFVYTSGVDREGRPVIVIVGHHLPAKDVEMDRVWLYMISVMDDVVKVPYVVVYLHTLASAESRPELSWMKRVYHAMPRRYKKNIKALYCVHPSFFLKVYSLAARPLVSHKFWKKLTYVSRLTELYSFFEPTQLMLPNFVFKHDREVNAEFYRRASVESGTSWQRVGDEPSTEQ